MFTKIFLNVYEMICFSFKGLVHPEIIKNNMRVSINDRIVIFGWTIPLNSYTFQPKILMWSENAEYMWCYVNYLVYLVSNSNLSLKQSFTEWGSPSRHNPFDGSFPHSPIELNIFCTTDQPATWIMGRLNLNQPYSYCLLWTLRLVLTIIQVICL